MPNLRNGTKGGFEPGLTRLRVRHSTTELPRLASLFFHLIFFLNMPLNISMYRSANNEMIQRMFLISLYCVHSLYRVLCDIATSDTIINELFPKQYSLIMLLQNTH